MFNRVVQNMQEFQVCSGKVRKCEINHRSIVTDAETMVDPHEKIGEKCEITLL